MTMKSLLIKFPLQEKIMSRIIVTQMPVACFVVLNVLVAYVDVSACHQDIDVTVALIVTTMMGHYVVFARKISLMFLLCAWCSGQTAPSVVCGCIINVNLTTTLLAAKIYVKIVLVNDMHLLNEIHLFIFFFWLFRFVSLTENIISMFLNKISIFSV